MRVAAITAFLVLSGCGPIVNVERIDVHTEDVRAIEMKQQPWMPSMSGEDDIHYDFKKEISRESQ